MKRILNFALIACAVFAASSCTFIRINKDAFEAGSGSEVVVGSKNIISKNYNVPQFTAVESTIAADIVYAMTDSEPYIIVDAPDNFIDKLNFKVEDGVLKVRFDDNRRYNFGKVKVSAFSSTLENLVILGAGDFDCSGLKCAEMNVSINGAGDVRFGYLECEGDVAVTVRGAGDIDFHQMSCQDVSVEIMGAGDVTLAGRSETAHLSIKGAGDIDASRLDCENITSSVAGMGSIRRK